MTKKSHAPAYVLVKIIRHKILTSRLPKISDLKLDRVTESNWLPIIRLGSLMTAFFRGEISDMDDKEPDMCLREGRRSWQRQQLLLGRKLRNRYAVLEGKSKNGARGRDLSEYRKRGMIWITLGFMNQSKESTKGSHWRYVGRWLTFKDTYGWLEDVLQESKSRNRYQGAAITAATSKITVDWPRVMDVKTELVRCVDRMDGTWWYAWQGRRNKRGRRHKC